MAAPLVLVSGTGTGIGKTLFSVGLVRAWGEQGKNVVGFKPIESGGAADGAALEQASTFHVTRFTPPYLLMDPVSPHLAARREDRVVEIGEVVRAVSTIRHHEGVEGVVVELPGGLFSPLSDTARNVELAKALSPTAMCLVSANRLGVLHDVIATHEASRSHALSLHAIVLSDTEATDSSTDSNEAELRRFLRLPVIRMPRSEDQRAPATSVLSVLGLT